MEKNTDYRALLIDGVKILESKRIDPITIDGCEAPEDPAEDTRCESCQ
jgi:hypothetical protein